MKNRNNNYKQINKRKLFRNKNVHLQHYLREGAHALYKVNYLIKDQDIQKAQ